MISRNCKDLAVFSSKDLYKITKMSSKMLKLHLPINLSNENQTVLIIKSVLISIMHIKNKTWFTLGLSLSITLEY